MSPVQINHPARGKVESFQVSVVRTAQTFQNITKISRGAQDCPINQLMFKIIQYERLLHQQSIKGFLNISRIFVEFPASQITRFCISNVSRSNFQNPWGSSRLLVGLVILEIDEKGKLGNFKAIMGRVCKYYILIWYSIFLRYSQSIKW